MEPTLVLQNLGIAVGLGLLVGLQREYADNRTAGIRTFALITLLGAIAGLLTPIAGGWIVGAGLLSLALLLYGINNLQAQQSEVGLGLTTEVAVLLMFVVGALVMLGFRAPAIAVGGVVVVLLQSKDVLHKTVDRLGEKDIKAIMQLALIALVVLPLLPDKTYGPFDVLNPREIWWMAVLIVGISLGAYVAYKLIGPRGGSLVQGVLGGLISSTATTVSAARQSKEHSSGAWLGAMIVVVAAAISLGRVIGLTIVFMPGHWRTVLPPLAIALCMWLVLGFVAWWQSRKAEAQTPDHDNPAELKAAIVFAGLYALVVLTVAAAKHYLGDKGLYIVAGVSGLTDMDAITISTARITEQGQVAGPVAWRVILIAMMSNTLFKLGAVISLGSKRLSLLVGTLFAIALAGSGVLLWVM